MIILIVFAIIAIVILYLILLGIKDNSKTKNRQIYLGYLQLKNDTSHFCLDYTVIFRRQINNYSTQKIYISFFLKCNIFIYNMSDLILLGKKGNSYFFLQIYLGSLQLKNYKNHFSFRSHYIVCETKYMCLIFI